MKFSLPWQSRSAKNEKRDALEVQGNGFNLGAIWSFLDGGSRGNESDEPVNDATSLLYRYGVHLLQSLGGWNCFSALPSLQADSNWQDGRLRQSISSPVADCAQR